MHPLPEKQSPYSFYDRQVTYGLVNNKQYRTLMVFGSNLAGRHGKGAAKDALTLHGAIYGQAEGLQGFSYGIPTKMENFRPLPLTEIENYVKTFVKFTKENPRYLFFVTAVGTGLTGYKDKDIAPMFKGAVNCYFPEEWREYLC
jgi:hypothetical protein